MRLKKGRHEQEVKREEEDGKGALVQNGLARRLIMAQLTEYYTAKYDNSYCTLKNCESQVNQLHETKRET